MPMGAVANVDWASWDIYQARPFSRRHHTLLCTAVMMMYLFITFGLGAIEKERYTNARSPSLRRLVLQMGW
jgi:hypothetical protein